MDNVRELCQMLAIYLARPIRAGHVHIDNLHSFALVAVPLHQLNQ